MKFFEHRCINAGYIFRSPTSEELYDKYKAKFGLRDCVVLLGDLNSVDMTKYTMVKKKTMPITLELAPTNIISSTRYKYKCDTCSLRFKDYAALEEHRKEHNSLEEESPSSKEDSSTTTSDVEEDETFSESSSSDDENEEGPIEGLYQCKLCNRTFKYNYTFANHMKQHKQYAYFVCTKCHKIHDTKEELEGHLQEEHKIFPCKHCPQMFYSERNLKAHLKQKHQEFTAINELEQHSEKHTEEENTVCDLCTKKFKNVSELDKHLSTHFSIVKILPKRNKNETGNEIDQEKPLTVKSIHTSNDHKCTLCNKMFLTKEHLDSHLEKHIHVHGSAIKESIPNTDITTTAVITTRKTKATNVISKSFTPTIPATTMSNVTAAPGVIKTVSGVPLLQNKQIIISSAASIPTTSNVSSNSLTLNSNQHKLLVMNDKKYLIVSESSPMSGNGLLKLVMTDPNKSNTVLQAIPALQPISAMQPINNFLQPAINQTIVLPNSQNSSQISITNQTYNTGDLNQGTTNIVYTTPTGETLTPIKVTKTYSGKSRKIIGKLLKTTMAPSAVFPNSGTAVSSGRTMTEPTFFLPPPTGNVVSTRGTITPATLVLAPTSEEMAPPVATITSVVQPANNLQQEQTSESESTPVDPEISEVIPKATPSDADDFKPKIFLKPLSQLLEKPETPGDTETGKILDEPASPDTENLEKPEDGCSVKTKRIYKCNECHVVCKRLGKLLQHQSKYKCKICSFGCCKLKMLDVHYSEQHDYKNRCVSCDTQFPTLSELQHHKKSVHLCKKCNRCYFDLNKHKNNYKCSNCDFYACGAASLDTHYKLVHRITTRCAPCNKIFYSNEAFQQHKQEIHYCDKCCTYKMDLNVHKTFCKGGPKASTSQPTSNCPEVIELDSD